MTRPGHAKPSRRGGFTLIELLVVISIIAVLMSLIAPAVQNARRSARNIQCKNHMHNLAIATQNFAASSNAGLPQAWSTMTVGDYNDSTATLTYYHNWVFPMLPLMDMAAVFNSIRQASILDTTLPAAARVATLKVEDQIYIPGLVCPEDLNNYGRSLGLSYVANTGYINQNLWGNQNLTVASQWHDLYRVDYNLNGDYLAADGSVVGAGADSNDAQYAIGGGVFWHNATSAEPRVTLDSIGQADGLTQTVMYAENINASNWASADPDTSCFGIAVDPTLPFPSPSALGAPNFLYVTDTSLALAPSPGFGAITVSSQLFQSARINSQPLTIAGTPRPSSSHLGVVNVVFCDGSTRTLNETIDISVYVRLLSPDGKRYGQMLVNATSY